MMKWLARLFRKNTNGNGAKPECADADLGEVTKKNVDQHSQKISVDLKAANDTLDGLLINTGEALGLHD